MGDKIYIAIDLKSFYASVECRERKLDPLKTNLVVADKSRTDKTICLAVSPSLKAYGVSARPRLFEVISKVREVNNIRKWKSPNKRFNGSSYLYDELNSNPSLSLDYIVAPPRMALYMEYSTRIYGIYLKYIAPEDIHVYSIDEVFIDATPYLKLYKMTAHELAIKMIRDVLSETGITATAGIGTNLYLAKVAMDIVAKRMKPDSDGVRIAELDLKRYRTELWDHKPLTDFWRIGRGYSKRLYEQGLYTMGDIALCSVGDSGNYYNKELLFKMFGINAELLIDHAWGFESCTIADIKSYRPNDRSLSTGQVLTEPYSFDKARIVTLEMADMLSLDLVDKNILCDQLVLTIGYDIENVSEGCEYSGEIKTDYYGRKMPRHATGTVNLEGFSSSTKRITRLVGELYDKITDRRLTVRRINISANHIIYEKYAPDKPASEQLDLFTDYRELEKQEKILKQSLEREKNMQKALLSIKKRYGKNAILKGMNLQEGATAMSRNRQIGGHQA